MEKVQITESDIKKMVLESVRNIFERRSFGTATGQGQWEPYEALIRNGFTEEDIADFMGNGTIPNMEPIYDIIASCSYKTEDDGDYYGSGPYTSYDNDRTYGGDYDAAVAAINTIQDEMLKKFLMDDLQATCENITCDEEQPYTPFNLDDGDKLYEYNEVGSEYGIDDSTQYTTYEFDTPQDFDQWCQDFGVNMHSVEVPVDLGPKFYDLIFYPKEAWIYMEDYSHEYGFEPNLITYGYADENVVPHKDWMADRFLEDKRLQIYNAIMNQK